MAVCVFRSAWGSLLLTLVLLASQGHAESAVSSTALRRVRREAELAPSPGLTSANVTVPGRRLGMWWMDPMAVEKDGTAGCEAEWTALGGKCYRVNLDKITWEEHRRECQAHGGDLAMPKRGHADLAVYQRLVLNIPSYEEEDPRHDPSDQVFCVGVRMKPDRVEGCPDLDCGNENFTNPGNDSRKLDSWEFADGSGEAPYLFGLTWWYNHWVRQPDNYFPGQRCSKYAAYKLPLSHGLLPDKGVLMDTECNQWGFRGICEKEPEGSVGDGNGGGSGGESEDQWRDDTKAVPAPPPPPPDTNWW
ncbi:unnamed protein product [Vitrella brassicaformis CCMP3155]|uniref:C-type lectin domain-containing protein n=2 Tax=Vitrella brassicaformis TaxID=1169539 RepID=A0A0G4EEY4_VITBC|nr:unnamed protein product [Vitrella brassicaformis CCMP3155]|eukprot:CEL94069.1 unnamed protein product [Vitrella brassicaformis CCMP3155]